MFLHVKLLWKLQLVKSVVPEGEALYVLEVTAGFVDQNNITEDSVLTIISI